MTNLSHLQLFSSSLSCVSSPWRTDYSTVWFPKDAFNKLPDQFQCQSDRVCSASGVNNLSRGIGYAKSALGMFESTAVTPGTDRPTVAFDTPTVPLDLQAIDKHSINLPNRELFSEGAAARVIAVVGKGCRSPWGDASWKEVLEHMSHKLNKADGELEMAVLEDQELYAQWLGQPHRAELFCQADIVVIVSVRNETYAKLLVHETTHQDTVVAFDSHPVVKSRLGGVEAVLSTNKILSALSLSAGKRNQAFNKMRQVTEMWNRTTSDNILAAVQLLIDAYVTPVKSLQKLQSKNLQSLMCIVKNCGPQLLAVMLDPECRESLTCMAKCDSTDQFGLYSCIVKHESSILAAFSQCALQKHNCLGLCAAIPMHLAVTPLKSFRDQPLTHSVAEKILIGWVNELGFSWNIVGNMFPIATHFASQRMTFYRDSQSRMWYDPTLLVKTEEGENQNIWRKRHYSVKLGKSPGTFHFSTLDNGVVTREFWTIVDVADDLSWSVMHSCGAAQSTGQTFPGTVVVTPGIHWPQDSPRLRMALEKCETKSWEVVRVDHSSTQGRPHIEGVPPQQSLLPSRV